MEISCEEKDAGVNETVDNDNEADSLEEPMTAMVSKH